MHLFGEHRVIVREALCCPTGMGFLGVAVHVRARYLGTSRQVILPRFAFHPGVILFGFRETPHWERQDPRMFLQFELLPH